MVPTEYSKRTQAPRPRTTKSDQSSLYFWFIKVLIVLGFIAVVIWLSLKPKSPVFEAHVLYQNSTFHDRNSSVIFISLRVLNPNKRIGVFYGDIYVNMYQSNGAVVGSKSIPGFYQGHEETDSFEVVVGGASDQPPSLRELAVASGGGRELKISLRTQVRYKIFRSNTKSHGFNVEANVTVGSDGTTTSAGEEGVRLHSTLKITKHWRKFMFVHL